MPIAKGPKAVMHLSAAFRKSATLLVNSGALAAGTLTTAAFGFVYWVIAARTFPAEAIGQASALLAVIGLIGLLGDAGLGTLLIGEIARHPGEAPRLVAAAICVGCALMLAVSVLFVVANLSLVGGGLLHGWFESLLFVFGGVLTGVSSLGCQALLGNLRATGRMVQQILFAVIKLALIVGAVVAGGASHRTIVVTWLGALAASWVVFDLTSGGGARRLLGVPDFALLGTLRRKIFDHYALDVATMAPGIIMPYLVLTLLSPTVNAAFASLWMLVYMAAIVPAVLATALFPVVIANPQQARHDILVSLSLSLVFSLGCALVVLIFSQHLLALFNPAYPAIAGSGLRLLGLGLFGLTLKFHACALARLGDFMRKAAWWFALGAMIEISMTIAGAKLGALQGLVIGWTLAVSLEGAAAALILGLYGRGSASPTPTIAGSNAGEPNVDSSRRSATADLGTWFRSVRTSDGSPLYLRSEHPACD